jgi:hypothetical protein
MQINTKGILIENSITPHLVITNDVQFSLKNYNGSWGLMNKKIVLVSLVQQSIINDTELLGRAINASENYSKDDFFYLPITLLQLPSLLQLIENTGAEKILFFGIQPHQVNLYWQVVPTLPIKIKSTDIIFFKTLETCFGDAIYKKYFATIWLKMLNTSWIKK